MKQKLNEQSKQYWVSLKEANFSETFAKSQFELHILCAEGKNSL